MTSPRLDPDPPLDVPTLMAIVERWKRWAPGGNYLQRLAYRMAKRLLDYEMQREVAEGVQEARKSWASDVTKRKG